MTLKVGLIILKEYGRTDGKNPFMLKINNFAKFAQIKLNNLNLKFYRLKGGKIVNFIHVGKTGGSAIKYALRNHLVTDQYKIHLRGHTCKLRDIPQGDSVFFFLREPISRFISSFYYKKNQKRRWKHPRFLEEKLALETFHSANDLAMALSAEDPDIKQAAVTAMESIEHVNTFYADWFDTKEYLLSRMSDILYIGFQETLEQDFENLKQILGLPKKLELPKDISKANKTLKDDTDLSEEARQNLISWYASDYEFYQLCQEKAEQIKRNL